jgi:hypothetical protein
LRTANPMPALSHYQKGLSMTNVGSILNRRFF